MPCRCLRSLVPSQQHMPAHSALTPVSVLAIQPSGRSCRNDLRSLSPTSSLCAQRTRTGGYTLFFCRRRCLRIRTCKSGRFFLQTALPWAITQHRQHHLRDPLLRVSQRPAAIFIRSNPEETPYIHKPLLDRARALRKFQPNKASNNSSIKPAAMVTPKKCYLIEKKNPDLGKVKRAGLKTAGIESAAADAHHQVLMAHKG